MKEFWFVVPDSKGCRLIWLSGIDFGGEPQEEKLNTMQPAYTKLHYGLLHKILANLAKELQKQDPRVKAPP